MFGNSSIGNVVEYGCTSNPCTCGNITSESLGIFGNCWYNIPGDGYGYLDFNFQLPEGGTSVLPGGSAITVVSINETNDAPCCSDCNGTLLYLGDTITVGDYVFQLNNIWSNPSTGYESAYFVGRSILTGATNWVYLGEDWRRSAVVSYPDGSSFNVSICHAGAATSTSPAWACVSVQQLTGGGGLYRGPAPTVPCQDCKTGCAMRLSCWVRGCCASYQATAPPTITWYW